MSNRRIGLGRLGLATVAASALLFVAPTAALADVNAVSGGAFGIQAIGIIPIPPTASVTLPPSGSPPISASALTVPANPVVTAGLLNAMTEGGNIGAHNGFAHSTASAATVNIGDGALVLALVSSECRADGDGSTGDASILDVNGNALAAPPNTAITVPGLVSVILNEQIQNDTPGSASMTVNAVHVRVLEDGSIEDIIVAQSRCGATGPDVIIPEVAMVVLLPISALLIFGTVYFVRRRRAAA